MKFTSEFHKDADDLTQAKNDAYEGVATRKERMSLIRKFCNGIAMMSPEEAKRLNRKEIINHLTTYSKLLGQVAMLQSMVTGTNQLVEVIVTTGDKEKDHITGVRLSKILNEKIFKRKGRFAAFWKKVAGEIVMSGGVPVVNEPNYGWLPKVSMDLIFPKGTELDAEEIPFCFEPKEYTYADLKAMLRNVQGEKGHIYDASNIRALIQILKNQVKDRNKRNSGFGEHEVTGSVRRNDGGLSLAKVDAWVYYEVKTRDKKGEDGSKYVSKTIFVDQFQAISEWGDDKTALHNSDEDHNSSSRILVHVEEAFKDAFEWLHFVAIDSEIGGTKNTDTLRGMAELIFPSGSEMENLFNLLLEGDKERAKPKFSVSNNAKKDDVLKWNIEQDTFAPEGLVELEVKANGQHLQTPFGMLDRNASSITGAPMANSPQGGELRVQATERQQSSSSVQTVRMADAYTHLEAILETAIWRLLAGPIKVGAEGYRETKGLREALKRAEIDYKTLSEREFDDFRWIRVRAKRVIGYGDPQQQADTGDWMLQNLQHVEPAARPIIIQTAYALRTGDPDLAELAIRPPEIILNQQRVIAENEFDTIARRAVIGMTISPQPDDIHHNHIGSHLIDLQSLIGENEIEPWGMRQSLVFAAVAEHISQHIQILISNPATNHEGNQFLPPFQQLIHESKPLLKAVQEQQDEEQQQLPPEEQFKMHLETAKLQLAAQKIGIELADKEDVRQQRKDRTRLSERGTLLSERAQYAREVESGRRHELDKEKMKKPEA